MRHKGHDIFYFGKTEMENDASSRYRLLRPYFLNYFLTMLPQEQSDEFSQNRSFLADASDLETVSCPLCAADSMSIIHIRKPFKVVNCSGCGLSYLSPRLKEPIMKKIYEGHGYFSEGDFTGYRDYISQEKSLRVTFRRFLAELQRHELTTGRLLEIGSGYGYFLAEARDFFQHISGVELSAKAATCAGKLSGINVHTGDLNSLPPEWRNFDVIIAINVIEHIYAPIEFLIAAKQRLKSGGRIVIATPDFGSFWYKILGDKWPSFKIPEHVTFYTSGTLSLLLERAGFGDIRKIRFLHSFPLGLISSKFGLNIQGKMAGINIWLPKTMIALAARL
jgi:SAM-dependent methyltransferase